MHAIVSREEWEQARKQLLVKEKALTRFRDALAAERRALPWVRVEKSYVFASPSGPVTLSDLFAGKSQLFVKHFMLGPGQVGQCVGCSIEVDHLVPTLVHLENHDVAVAVVARAPIDEIEAVRKRMGWPITWVSSYGTDFNYDFHVSFRPEEMAAGRGYYNYRWHAPGLEDYSGDSVFFKDESGQIFHTYSCFNRGAEEILATYVILDMTPKGRNEPGPYKSLADWVRPHDMYGRGGTVEGNGRFHRDGCGCTAHEQR